MRFRLQVELNLDAYCVDTHGENKAESATAAAAAAVGFSAQFAMCFKVAVWRQRCNTFCKLPTPRLVIKARLRIVILNFQFIN